MNRIAIIIAIVALLGGCKKQMKEDEPVVDFRADWKTLLDLREAMCSCPDKACAETTLAKLRTWQSTGAKRDYTPSVAQTADMNKVTQEIAACMTTAQPRVDEVAPAPVPSAAPPTPTVPATPKPPVTVDQLVGLAQAFAVTVHPQYVAASIDAVYVDAEGVLDPEDGALSVVIGTAIPTDDPRRRLGAPVKPPPAKPTECMKLTWKLSGWVSERYDCVEARRPFPRCTITEIWKRAIAKGTPADAVATVQLREATPRRWVFTLVDEPRKINIQHNLPDDCELSLEKQ